MNKCGVWMVRGLRQWQVSGGSQVQGPGEGFAEALYPPRPLSRWETFSFLSSEASGQTLITILGFQVSNRQDEIQISTGIGLNKQLPHHEAQNTLQNT